MAARIAGRARRYVVVGAAIPLVAAGWGVAAAARTGPGAALSALLARESAVEVLLHHYPGTGPQLGAWEAKLHAAEAAQGAAEATLNAALAGGKPVTPSQVGQTRIGKDYSGGAIAVTLARLADPARPSAATGRGSGALVGVELVLRDLTTSATESGTANEDATIVGSDGFTYKPVAGGILGCPDFGSASLWLLNGSESATGCVAFRLPPGVRPAIVRFDPTGGYMKAPLAWRI